MRKGEDVAAKIDLEGLSIGELEEHIADTQAMIKTK